MYNIFPDEKLSWHFRETDFQTVRLRLKEVIRAGNLKRKVNEGGNYFYGEYEKGLWYIYQNLSREGATTSDLKFILRFIETSEKTVYMKITVKNRFWVLVFPAVAAIFIGCSIFLSNSAPVHVPVLFTTGFLLFLYIIAKIRFKFSKGDVKRFAEHVLLASVELL